MARWFNFFPAERLTPPAVVMPRDKPGTQIAKVLTEIQEKVPNEFEGQGDDNVEVDANMRGNKLTIRVRLKGDLGQDFGTGSAGMVLTLGDDGEAYWDWVRAVDATGL